MSLLVPATVQPMPRPPTLPGYEHGARGTRGAMIQAYASRTGTARNLDAMRERGWRLLVSAAGVHRTEGMRYAIDNGAWSAYTTGRPWDRQAFERLVADLGRGVDWVVAPDVVADAQATRHLYLEWVPVLRDICPVLVAVQDGMVPWDVRDAIHRGAAGLFLGGSTEWKLRTMAMWGRFAALPDVMCYFHVARANTVRRIRQASICGAHSFDGTSATRWASTLPLLDGERRLAPRADPPPPQLELDLGRRRK